MAIYHLVFVVAFLAYAPVLAWRMLSDRRYRKGIWERMGRVPRRDPARPAIWIHGVSVGEVKAAGTLIRELEQSWPGIELVLSATTPTGHELARRLHPGLRVIFYPLDFGLFPGRALDRIAPAAVLLVELEVWPNFLQSAARRGVPVSVVNGRISQRSFRGYRRARGFLPQFNLIEKFCVQDEPYRRRLLDLDVDPACIHVTGNLKYDSVALREPPGSSAALRQWLSADGRLVVVAGSTHHDEELRVARAVRAIEGRLGGPVRLVVAPRHPERAGLRDTLIAAGLECVCWSAVEKSRTPLSSSAILLVDTIGQLEGFYGACDIAFVGGSLVPRGGQNMLEPAALGKAVIFGPHVDNFRTDVDLLLAGGGCVQAGAPELLEAELEALLRDGGRRAALGQNALAVIRRNQGATARTLEILAPRLADVAAAGVEPAQTRQRRPTGAEPTARAGT
jgi:3-deoxy-D-manno-octulosonic-acid transferase